MLSPKMRLSRAPLIDHERQDGADYRGLPSAGRTALQEIYIEARDLAPPDAEPHFSTILIPRPLRQIEEEFVAGIKVQYLLSADRIVRAKAIAVSIGLVRIGQQPFESIDI